MAFANSTFLVTSAQKSAFLRWVLILRIIILVRYS